LITSSSKLPDLGLGISSNKTGKPHTSESWDEVVFCSDIIRTGRVCPTNYEQRQPHDYIELPSLSIEGISSKAAEFYASGLSLRQISKHLNKSKTFIRKTLLEAGVALRGSKDVLKEGRPRTHSHHTGNTPFGYRCLRGRLILDAREIEIVQLVMNLWTAGQPYSSIAKHLNKQGIKNRKATPWDHSLVRSIVERHKDKPLVIEEK
jgi:hypothetical protein